MLKFKRKFKLQLIKLVSSLRKRAEKVGKNLRDPHSLRGRNKTSRRRLTWRNCPLRVSSQRWFHI